MRRKDREVTDPSEIVSVIKACEILRIGFWDGEDVYVVPVNFGYSEENGRYTLYFHGAGEGRKYELLKSAPKVGFEMDTGYTLKRGRDACSYSAYYRSVIGSGIVSVIEDGAEKERALRAIMYQSTGEKAWTFEENALKKVCVCKLAAEKLSCKEHLPPNV